MYVDVAGVAIIQGYVMGQPPTRLELIELVLDWQLLCDFFGFPGTFSLTKCVESVIFF